MYRVLLDSQSIISTITTKSYTGRLEALDGAAWVPSSNPLHNRAVARWQLGYREHATNPSAGDVVANDLIPDEQWQHTTPDQLDVNVTDVDTLRLRPTAVLGVSNRHTGTLYRPPVTYNETYTDIDLSDLTGNVRIHLAPLIELQLSDAKVYDSGLATFTGLWRILDVRAAEFDLSEISFVTYGEHTTVVDLPPSHQSTDTLLVAKMYSFAFKFMPETLYQVYPVEHPFQLLDRNGNDRPFDQTILIGFSTLHLVGLTSPTRALVADWVHRELKASGFNGITTTIPTSTVKVNDATLEMAVRYMHQHSNLAVLERFSVGEGGILLFDGNPVSDNSLLALIIALQEAMTLRPTWQNLRDIGVIDDVPFDTAVSGVLYANTPAGYVPFNPEIHAGYEMGIGVIVDEIRYVRMVGFYTFSDASPTSFTQGFVVYAGPNGTLTQVRPAATICVVGFARNDKTIKLLPYTVWGGNEVS